MKQKERQKLMTDKKKTVILKNIVDAEAQKLEPKVSIMNPLPFNQNFTRRYFYVLMTLTLFNYKSPIHN